MARVAPDGLMEGRDIICFANDWDGDPLSKKHIMRLLAKRNRILWVNSLGMRKPQASVRDLRRSVDKLSKFVSGCQQRESNLFVYSPLAIPFHSNCTAQWLNRKWLSWNLRRVCRRLAFRNPITWTFLPTSADVVGTLGEQMIIYHCVDEFSEFTGTDKAGLLQMERRLIEKAHLVIVSSEPLLKTKRQYNPNTFLVMHGVDVDHFRKACDPATAVPDDIASLQRPVIGFHGLIADWVDLELVRFLASARRDWSFVLLGKVETRTDALRGLSNVHLIGRKDYGLLPAYCKGFDAAILPFAINELTLAANPLKLREYLAAGLPVVATPIPEATRLGNLIRIGSDYAQFLQQIERLLAEGKSGPSLAVSQAMDSESWTAKVAELCQLLAQCEPLKRQQTKGGLATGIQESWLGNS